MNRHPLLVIISVTAALLLWCASVPAQVQAGKAPIVFASFDSDFNNSGPFALKGNLNGDELELLPGLNGNAFFVGGTEDWIDLPLVDEIAFTGGASAELWFRL
jgi:hypothetical protein